MRTRYIFMAFGLAAATALFADGGGSAGGGSASMGSGPKAAPAPTAQSWYDLGYKAAKGAKYDEAIADFDEALKLRPDYAEALNMKGYSLRKNGKLDEAFTYYEKALTLKPNFANAREYYGEASLQAGDLKKAVQQYLILQKAHASQAKELLAWIDAYVNGKTPPAEDI